MVQLTLTSVLDRVCNTIGPTKIFKSIAINKLIKSVEVRRDEEIRLKIIQFPQANLDSRLQCALERVD